MNQGIVGAALLVLCSGIVCCSSNGGGTTGQGGANSGGTGGGSGGKVSGSGGSSGSVGTGGSSGNSSGGAAGSSGSNTGGLGGGTGKSGAAGKHVGGSAGSSAGRAGSSSGGTPGAGGGSGSGNAGKGNAGKGNAGAGAGNGGGAGGGTAAPYFVGRFDVSDANGPRFAWPGSLIRARFSGTAISVDLNQAGATNYFAVSVDGQLQPNKLATTAGRSVYPLATGLASGEHEVALQRITEAFQGENQFFGFKFPNGGNLLPILPAQRRLEVIGDSISAGYGVEGANETCPFSPATENQSLTYAALTATHFSADLVAVAFSGKGIVSNRGDTTDTVTMPSLWKLTLPDRADSAWDFQRFTPDAVLINLGTNDFFTGPNSGLPPSEYLKFVRDVRHTYPSAHIFCLLGPMLSDSYPVGKQELTLARQAIQGAADTLHGEGDHKVSFLEFDSQDGSNGYGCDYHPSKKENEVMASKLQTALGQALGW